MHFEHDHSVADFAIHHASWHKSCHLKCNNSKLAKAKKSRVNNTDDSEKRLSRKHQATEVYSSLSVKRGRKKAS